MATVFYDLKDCAASCAGSGSESACVGNGVRKVKNLVTVGEIPTGL